MTAVPDIDQLVETVREALAIAWPEGDHAEPNVFTEALTALSDLAARARLADAQRKPFSTTMRGMDRAEAAEADRDSLRLALDAEKHNHRKDNEHLIGERDRLARRAAELEAARDAADLILNSFELIARSLNTMSVGTIREYIDKTRTALAGNGGGA